MKIWIKFFHLRGTSVLIAISGFCVALAFCGCAPKTKSPAIGMWIGQESKESMKFGSDGSLRGTDRYGRALTGSFEFIDADHVRIKTTISQEQPNGSKFVDNAEVVCQFKVEGDLLTLSEQGGASSHFRRAK